MPIHAASICGSQTCADLWCCSDLQADRACEPEPTAPCESHRERCRHYPYAKVHRTLEVESLAAVATPPKPHPPRSRKQTPLACHRLHGWESTDHSGIGTSQDRSHREENPWERIPRADAAASGAADWPSSGNFVSPPRHPPAHQPPARHPPAHHQDPPSLRGSLARSRPSLNRIPTRIAKTFPR